MFPRCLRRTSGVLRRVAEVLRNPAGVHKSRFSRFPVGQGDNAVRNPQFPALDPPNPATSGTINMGSASCSMRRQVCSLPRLVLKLWRRSIG